MWSSNVATYVSSNEQTFDLYMTNLQLTNNLIMTKTFIFNNQTLTCLWITIITCLLKSYCIVLLQNTKKKDKSSMPIIQKQLNVYIHLCHINLI
jgi:hypothetical protein